MGELINLDPLIAGRKKTLHKQILDDDGAAVAMGGAKVFFMAKTAEDDADASAVIDVTVTVPDDTDAGNGWFDFEIPASEVPFSLVDTEDISLYYTWDYMLTELGDGENISYGQQPVIKTARKAIAW